jgi:hypothetical protein
LNIPMVPGTVYYYKAQAHNSIGWSDLPSTNERRVVIYSADGVQQQSATLPSCTLVVNKIGTCSGDVIISPPDPIYCGSTVTLTVDPADGCVFGGWGGDCTGMEECLLTVDSPKNVTADFVVNNPPDQPSSEKIQNNCAWGSTPQAALGTALTFNWTYSDPDNDPQAAYEVEVDSDTSFLAPKFNHLVNLAGISYVLDPSQDDNADWLANLAWDATYYWRVKVADDQGGWSIWSASDSFQTPAHAYPNPYFTHQPVFPSIDEEILLSDNSKCYDDEDNFSPCRLTSDSAYQWDFENDGFTDSTIKGDATTSFPTVGIYRVKLTVSDSVGVCQTFGDTPLNVQVPLPGYQEIPPFIWLKNTFLAFLKYFKPYLAFGQISFR